MQTRLGARLAYVGATSRPTLEAVTMPPGMLITLTENAIKHGIEPSPQGGRIDVSRARATATAAARCRVADTGAGLGGGRRRASGIGLANIRERLALLYGDARRSSSRQRAARLPRAHPAAGRRRRRCRAVRRIAHCHEATSRHDADRRPR